MIFDKLYKNEADVLNQIDSSLISKKCRKLTYLNQHCFNIYNSNSEYRILLDNKFEVFLDGIGIYLVLLMLGYKNLQRFNATDLYDKIFNLFSYGQTSLFLIGGKFGKEFITDKAPEKNLNIVGYHNGYFNEQQFLHIVEELKIVKPEVIIIAMGAPKQEILADKLSTLLNVKLILCVGGFLEFYFGTKQRATKVLQNIGMEWLYRLITEPGRLWKRYLIGIPLFLFNICKYSIKLKSEKSA